MGKPTGEENDDLILLEEPAGEGGEHTPWHIIRRIRLAHCAKGPVVCAKCREMDREEICLLDISPPNYGMVARRMIDVQVEGEKIWREFDIVQIFTSEEEATAYAEENGIGDVQF